MHEEQPANQYILRLQAPLTAARARPGCFVHIQCDNDLQMRRPMSIMRADTGAGWIDILYKIHGLGTGKLARRKAGQYLDLLGPIGMPFKLKNYRRLPLLIGGGVGIPPMVYLAEHMKQFMPDVRPLVIMGSEIPFPFKIRPSQIMIDGIAADIIATMPLLEDWKIPCRLTSCNDYAGCYQGYVTDLARQWLDSLNDNSLENVEIFACGPTPMLRAASFLAQEYGLPCQISVEEYMACAVGGCAGCTVEIQTGNGPAMKRVCVDGPVFEAATVFPLPA
ncbi:MAG TPA: dihydroorotate dehydrogenase electron transfer subunit [Gammaproteobacteria bacterium]|nr:dihydroorotate dehydrogenase electron transfer subunit [Gammaproteobacteria bacterium]